MLHLYFCTNIARCHDKVRSNYYTHMGNVVLEAKIRAQVVSTARLRFPWLRTSAAPLPALSGSTSQSPAAPAPKTPATSSPSVLCRYFSPVSFRYASIAFVAKEFPRKVSRSSSTKNMQTLYVQSHKEVVI